MPPCPNKKWYKLIAPKSTSNLVSQKNHQLWFFVCCYSSPNKALHLFFTKKLLWLFKFNCLTLCFSWLRGYSSSWTLGSPEAVAVATAEQWVGRIATTQQQRSATVATELRCQSARGAVVWNFCRKFRTLGKRGYTLLKSNIDSRKLQFLKEVTFSKPYVSFRGFFGGWERWGF